MIAQRTLAFPLAIVSALFPRLAAQTDEQSEILGKAPIVLVARLSAFIVTGLICLAQPLMQLWLGTRSISGRSSLDRSRWSASGSVLWPMGLTAATLTYLILLALAWFQTLVVAKI